MGGRGKSNEASDHRYTEIDAYDQSQIHMPIGIGPNATPARNKQTNKKKSTLVPTLVQKTLAFPRVLLDLVLTKLGNLPQQLVVLRGE